MHPAFLDDMSWEMAEVYGAIQDQILINLARHFPFYVAGESVPRSAFAYQAQMMAQMGQVSRETIRIIRNNLADADMALQGVLEQAVIDAVKTSQPELLEGVKKGVFAMLTTPIVAPNQMRAFQLYYQQAAQKLNLVNTVMLESTESAYRQTVSDVVSQISIADRIGRTQQALDVAAGETITGVSSWNAALKHATDRLKEGGITGFIDHAGHQWSAEAYVAMDIRTTVFNTGREAVWETNQDFGNDLYIVSYHNGARPLCYPYQNKVISSMDAARTTFDLDGNPIEVIAQSATSYGAAAGLFGINCKHYPTPFIPGVSVIEGQPQDKETNDRVYAESQEQRRLERKLREEKRDLQMMKAQGAPEDQISKQREKCRKSSEDIDEFCKETGRARHRDREAVYTKREFPDADRYDVAAFEREQKDLIDSYYQSGGAQQNYTSREMERKPTESEYSFLPSNRNEINIEYIQSPEYAERFAGITGNEATDKSIASAAQNMLLHRTGSNQEDLALIDATTGHILHTVDTSKSLFSVDYDEKALQIIEDARKTNRQIIAVHNHPNNYPPSLDDGSSAMAHGYTKGVVVGHDGNIYTYTKTNEVVSTAESKAVHAEIAIAIEQGLSLEPWFTTLEEYGMIITKR